MHIDEKSIAFKYAFFTVSLCIKGCQLLTWKSYAENCPEKVLKWSDRLAILIGVAKAVHFLHTGVMPGSFNNRLRTNNILLDEHRIPKLSDYGMSVIMDENEKLEVYFLAIHMNLLS